MTIKAPIWTKPFISLFSTNLAIFTVFYGLITTLPLYAKGTLSRTDGEAGLLVSVFLLSAIVVRPFCGKLLDFIGKRKVLWISLALFVFFTILYYFIHSFEGLLILRFTHGIWFSIVTTAAGAIAADNVPQSRRGAGIGYFTMSTNLAAVLGPFVGLLIIQYFTFDTLFIIMSGFIILGAIASLTIPEGNVTPINKENKKMVFSDLIEKRAFPIALLGSLVAFSYASILSYLSIYAQEKGMLELASYFFVVFAGMMLITRPITGRIFDEKGPNAVMYPGFIFFIIGFIMLAFMQSGFTFLFAGVFIGLGYGAIVPSLQTIALQSTGRERSGYATATFFTMFDLGIALGSFFLGILAISQGYKAVYLLSALLIMIVFIFLLITQKKRMAGGS